MNLFERMAAGLGGMIGAYQKARIERIRPAFLSDWASSKRWSGGDMTEREEAQRRALQNSWFFSGVRRKAEKVGAAKFEVVLVSDDPEAEPIPVKNHPFELIMRRPNPFMGRSFLWQFTQSWIDMDGSGYWFIAPDAAGRPAEIWPMPSCQVNPVPGDKDRFIDYYEFSSGGRIFNINAEYICHFRIPNPFDIFRGLSSLAPGMLPVDTDNAMSYWNGALFGENNVMPSAIINLSSGNPDAPIDDADLQKVKTQLRAEYQAWMRKTAITSADKLEVFPLGWSQKDSDFLGGRQFSKEEIWIILGIPPGLYDKSATEANATVAMAQFHDVIWSELVLLAEQMTAQILIPWYGEGFAAQFEDIRITNRTAELAEDTASREVLTIDERRERYYKAPALPDGRGELTAVEQGMGGIQDAQAAVPDTEIPDLVDAGGELPAPANAVPEATRADLKRWRDRSIKALRTGDLAVLSRPFASNSIPVQLAHVIGEGIEQAQTVEDIKAVFASANTKGVIRSWRPWSGVEEQLTSAIEGFLAAQAQRIIDRIGAQGPTSIADPEAWHEEREQLMKEIQPVLLNLSKQAVSRVRTTLGASGMGVDWGLANERAGQWAQDHAGQLIRQVTDTTRKEVAGMVAEWSQSSEGLDGLINRIAGMTDDDEKPVFNLARAERIAVTEATNTYAGANAQAWAEAGYAPAAFKPAAHVKCRCYLQPFRMPDGTRVLTWYTAMDERVCSQPIKTPWGTVQGCRGLHRVVVSEGPHLGKKV